MRKNKDFVFLQPVKWLGIGMMAALAVACEKPVLDETPTPDDGEANVILHFSQFEQSVGFPRPSEGRGQGWGTTRAATDITEICARLNIAIFDGEGTKVKTIRNQVTCYTGSFFGSGGGGETGSGDFRMTADPDWDAVNGYTF